MVVLPVVSRERKRTRFDKRQDNKVECCTKERQSSALVYGVTVASLDDKVASLLTQQW